MWQWKKTLAETVFIILDIRQSCSCTKLESGFHSFKQKIVSAFLLFFLTKIQRKFIIVFVDTIWLYVVFLETLVKFRGRGRNKQTGLEMQKPKTSVQSCSLSNFNAGWFFTNEYKCPTLHTLTFCLTTYRTHNFQRTLNSLRK